MYIKFHKSVQELLPCYDLNHSVEKVCWDYNQESLMLHRAPHQNARFSPHLRMNCYDTTPFPVRHESAPPLAAESATGKA